MTRLFLAIIPVVVAASIAPSAQAPPSGRVYVALTDSKGLPISIPTVPEFAIRVDGQEATVLSAVPATEPLALVLLTEGMEMPFTQEVRKTMRAVVASMRRHNPASRIGLMLAPGPAAPVMHGVVEGEADLEKEIVRFVGGQQMAPLLEAIQVATKVLTGEASARRIVLAFAAGDASNHNVAAPGQVLRDLRQSGVSLWTLDFGWGARGLGLSEERVLAEATQFSGGRRQFARSMVLPVMAERLLDVIRSQYLVTYRMPDGASDMSVLRVGVRRNEAIVLAPSWVFRR